MHCSSASSCNSAIFEVYLVCFIKCIRANKTITHRVIVNNKLNVSSTPSLKKAQPIIIVYQTDDDTIQVGDQVVVPVGDEGTERVVRVSKKSYYSSENVPMPVEKVKFIIEKFVMPEGKVLYCPMCECEISDDDCYDLQYDPLIDSIEGIITAKEVEQRKEICERCKYHDE